MSALSLHRIVDATGASSISGVAAITFTDFVLSDDAFEEAVTVILEAFDGRTDTRGFTDAFDTWLTS